jgi:diguanylate cyclase (GGDEF)-like protein
LVGTIQDITSLKQIEAAMQGLIECTVGFTGAECYHRIAHELCNWFAADCAIVGQLVGDSNVVSLAMVQDGVLIMGKTFPLAGTPCEKVVDDGGCLFSDGLAEHFPNSELVGNMQAQGYVGTPVRNCHGTIVGVLSVLSRQPIKRMERAKDVLAIMAARISAEMEREQSEQRLRENESHLKFLAYHDVLTELPNRLLFRDRLQHAISTASLAGTQVAVLFLDLDRFKKINDSLGHELGDQLLCEVARRLKLCARDTDTVARLSGDEFAMIIDQTTSVENVITVAEEIRGALSKVIDIEDYKLFVTVSIGISLYPRDGETVVSLLKGADAAMFNAKDVGRDNYRFYTAGLNERAGELLMLEGALREAVDLNRLVVHYQPQVDLVSGDIVGVEALVRWLHPEQGMIPPADFIPLAEETGLIIPIGEWVLRQACVQGKAWQRAGYKNINISVNMSARQFGQKNVVEMIEKILFEAGLSAEYLDLEITESVLMNDVATAIATMTQLSDLGVKLSIDDFGTGFSSLAYLKRFPINTLKIDKSFVQDVVTNPSDAAIATTIVDLARNMNLSVIAEGIETEEQRDYLQSHGCRLGQGYLFSRPQPADEVVKLFKQLTG